MGGLLHPADRKDKKSGSQASTGVGLNLPHSKREVNDFVKQLAILGSTGSIGRQCISVVESLPVMFAVFALAAGAHLEQLLGQIERHLPEPVSVADAKRADDLSQLL